MKQVHSDNVFNCDQCDKQFSIRHNLTKHVKASHGGEKINCSVCQGSFPATSLKVHEDSCREKYLRDIKKYYNPKPKPKFHCDKCQKVFGKAIIG